MNKEKILKKLAGLGPATDRVIVFDRAGKAREVLQIGSSSNYLFEATCGLGDEVIPRKGDAVFTLCSSRFEQNREYPYRGQAAMFARLT